MQLLAFGGAQDRYLCATDFEPRFKDGRLQLKFDNLTRDIHNLDKMLNNKEKTNNTFEQQLKELEQLSDFSWENEDL
jgi:hypothetical protein